jgi:acetyl esterase/lipase
MRIQALLAVFLLVGFAGAEEEWERFPDGSTGRNEEFRGIGGIAIPAYIRKPDGPGPFPVVVMLHGGRYGKAATVGMGRSTRSPTADFIKEGWAVYSVDYRPSEKMLEPIEIDDTIEAVKAVRKMPFIDPTRIGFLGGSHGANVASRLISRVDASGAILCAPAAIDLIEVKKAPGRGEAIVPILKRLIAEMEAKLGASAEEIEKDPARYGYRSAFTEAAQARCPILIINGRDDDNSPPSVIEAYVARLRAAGKPVETYLPDHGPHGFYFGRPDIPAWKESTRRAVEFFRRRFAPEAGATDKASVASKAAPREVAHRPASCVPCSRWMSSGPGDTELAPAGMGRSASPRPLSQTA